MASNRFRSLLLIVALPQVIAAPSFLAVRDTATIADEFLTTQNTVRAKHGAANLTWNSTLADYAAQWASKCDLKLSNGPYENGAAGPGNWTVRDIVNFWARDPKLTQSYFTQMVWNTTTELGCANYTCAPGTVTNVTQSQVFFCEYYPPGNLQGEYSENVQL